LISKSVVSTAAVGAYLPRRGSTARAEVLIGKLNGHVLEVKANHIILRGTRL